VRTRLPDRRHQITQMLAWALDDGKWQARAYLSAGIDPVTGAIKEVFLRGAGKVGSERDFLYDDIAVCIARTLQHGDTLTALGAGMGRSPEGKPMSLLGAVVDALIEIERDIKPPQPSNIVRLR
jgi:hypothetical protein